MEFNRLTSHQVECTIDASEMKKWGIEPGTCGYHTPQIRALFEQLKNEVIEKYGLDVGNMPLIIEAVPTKDNLSIILSWIDSPSDALNANYSTFYESSLSDDADAADGSDSRSESMEEIQSGIISDMLSALGSGNIMEKLSKYLNEDFLKRLIEASPENSLENIINSFLGDYSDNNSESAGNTTEVRFTGNDKDAFQSRMDRYIEKAEAITGVPFGTDPSGASAVLMITFKSLYETESALSKAQLSQYKGDSCFVKADNGSYILFISQGRLTKDEFQNAIQPLSLLPNAALTTKGHMTFVLEHEDVLIPSDAVCLLTKK